MTYITKSKVTLTYSVTHTTKMMDHYLQKELVINNRELVYKGIFRYKELFNTINKAIEEKGYHKNEKKTEELVAELGKKVFVELRPYKYITSYGKVLIKMKILLDKVTETMHDGQKFQQGDVSIVFDAWVLTDYEARWGMKPFVYFMKGLIHQFIYKWPLESGFQGIVAQDTAFIYAQIKKLFRSYSPKHRMQISESDVMKEMEEMITKN